MFTPLVTFGIIIYRHFHQVNTLLSRFRPSEFRRAEIHHRPGMPQNPQIPYSIVMAVLAPRLHADHQAQQPVLQGRDAVRDELLRATWLDLHQHPVAYSEYLHIRLPKEKAPFSLGETAPTMDTAL